MSGPKRTHRDSGRSRELDATRPGDKLAGARGRLSRRRVLATLAALPTAAIAGCLGDTGGEPQVGDGGDGDESQSGDDGDGGDTNTPGEPTEEGPDDDIENYNPEDVAKTYYNALGGGNKSTLDDLSHSDGIVIHTHADRAEQYKENYKLTIKRTDVVMEDLAYFYQPSAVVEVGYELDRKGNSASVVTRDQVVLVVEDGDLLVYDTRSDDNEIRDGELVDSCEIETDSDVLDLFPYTTESFYHISRREAFGDGDAEYRGPDGNWFFLEIGVHDSEEEAAEVEPGVGATHKKGDGEWTIEAALLARNGNMTCDVRVANADATDQVETLYQELGCFTDDHVVERSWE